MIPYAILNMDPNEMLAAAVGMLILLIVIFGICELLKILLDKEAE